MHQLQDRTESGLEMDYFIPGGKADKSETLGAHRDDHYMFFLVESGSAQLMIDFELISFVPGMLYFVLPGQVHHRIDNVAAHGWFLAVDTGLLTPEQRLVFEQRLTLQRPVVLLPHEQERYHNLLQQLYLHYSSDAARPFYRQVLYSLLQAFTGVAAAQYREAENTGGQLSRKAELAQAFKTLLTIHVRSIKSPSDYAEKLNVSTAYLNEALKKITGMPVSYWIMQEVTLEARRLLYYSQLNVKEIAYELGYEDHTYFSRVFRQHTGMTPLAFRRLYHE